ncbi:uncharacterized protein LOC144664253 isoform X2 [Oculina patagonica]
MISTIFTSALTFLLIKLCSADNASFGSTRGCDSACQKECIEVINKYRLNHHAKNVKFSQFLADKAQKWADGGRFGYDMKSRGRYGQLIEWDVKDELQNFTTVIKHWHDKEKDFDFATGRSKTGKTLHDFTQIVWKKAKKAGCGQSEIFGSKYYVVWMDSDGVVSPDMEGGTAIIGSPEKEDLHWFESEKESSKPKHTYVVPLKAQDEDSSSRTHVEPLAPVVLRTGSTRSKQSKPTDSPDLNEVREEQRVLNNNALLKQYLYHDSLNNVVLNENKETASYHVVSGAEDNANWQKGSESLIQLGRNKVNTTQTSPNRVTSYPVGEGEEEGSKEASRFQSQVIQDDDMLTKDEVDDNTTPSTEANDGDELGEGDEREQAAKIQSLMKQEDDMIQNQEAEEDEESSGGNNTAEGATSGTSNVDTNTVVATTSSSNTFAKTNESVVSSTNTAKQQKQKSASFYASGIALNNNPNDTNESAASNDKPSIGSSGNTSSSSHPGHLMMNQSSMNIHQDTPSGSPSNGSLKIKQKGDNATDAIELSNNSSSQNEAIATNGTQSIMLHHTKMATQVTTIQQSDATGGAVAPGSTNTVSNVGRNGMRGVNQASSPTILSSQGGMKPSQQHIGMKPIMSNSQSRPTLTDLIVPGASIKPKGKSPDVSHLETTNEQPQQSGSPTVNQHTISGESLDVSHLEVTNKQSKQSGSPTVNQHPISGESPDVSHLQATHEQSQQSGSPTINKHPISGESPNVSHLEVTNEQPQQFASPTVNQHPISGESQDLSHLQATHEQPKQFGLPTVNQHPISGESLDVSHQQATNKQPQQSGSPTVNQHPISAASGSLKNETLTLVSNRLSPGAQATGTNAAVQSPIASPIKVSDSVSDVHHVSSPAMITLPSASNRPIKLVFHVQDMKSNGMSPNAPVSGSETVTGFQTTPALSDDLVNKMNDEECHDDTLQCHLWAHHGHCKGMAYAEFMKRHCKATCGYCGLPSVIKQSVNRIQTHNLAQDEPCEDAPNYEFSCPRWQAQGYCEKKEKEMRLVCRKTCGFCVPAKNKIKSQYSSALQTLPKTSQAGPENGDRNTGEVQAPTLSKPFSSTPPKPNLNLMPNDIAKFTPSSGVQTLNISPLKPKVSLLQYVHKLPISSSLKDNKPFGGSIDKQNANLNVKNLTDASGISTQPFRNEQSSNKSASLNIKSQDGRQGVGSSKDLSNSTLKSKMSQKNQSTAPDQIGLKASTFLSSGQGVSNKLNNFIKAPVNIDATSLNAPKPQLATFSTNEKVSNENSGSEKEDKMIQDGIIALQHKLQAPLQISAVAKSKAGCKERLCKEKVKTQQAKTRGTIGDQVPVVSSTRNTTEKPVSTTGCDISCQRECLAAHNRYRLNHGASPLILDQTLADQAQQWADKKVFKHSPWAGGQGGETIALGSLYPTFTAAVKAWHDEEKDYDWSTGTGNRDMKISHFTQVVWKGAHLLGCGKTFVNGEPYYIAQMDTPGVIAGVPGYDKSNVGEPREPDLMWFMDSSPYWKEMQTKNYIPRNIEHRIL